MTRIWSIAISTTSPRGVRALRREIDSAVNIDDESLQVMMRAGRRSVEEALEEAREKADSMVAEAEAESERILSQAHVKANQIRAAGDDEARRQEETIEIRRIEIEALDEEIALRQKALRAAAAELLRLADGIVDDGEAPIDLRDSDVATSDEIGAGGRRTGAPARLADRTDDIWWYRCGRSVAAGSGADYGSIDAGDGRRSARRGARAASGRTAPGSGDPCPVCSGAGRVGCERGRDHVRAGAETAASSDGSGLTRSATP